MQPSGGHSFGSGMFGGGPFWWFQLLIVGADEITCWERVVDGCGIEVCRQVQH